jgi:adenylate kinase family enzyme
MSEGKLVPSKMLVQIIKHNIFKEGPNEKVYLLDGFPRSEENYDTWKEVFGDSVKIKTLIYLRCQLETLEKRLLKRGESSGRSDDNITTIRKRFNTYVRQTAPFLEYYEQNVGKVHKIEAEDEIETVS